MNFFQRKVKNIFDGGYSLVEMVIYIAILSFITVFVVYSLVLVIRSFVGFNVTRNIIDSASLSMDRMVREIRFADSIDVANSVFDSNPGTLSLNTTVYGTTTKAKFYILNNRIAFDIGTTTGEYLTSNKITVSNLVFRRSIASTTSESVKIEMSLEGGDNDTYKSENFYDTAVLRKLY